MDIWLEGLVLAVVLLRRWLCAAYLTCDPARYNLLDPNGVITVSNHWHILKPTTYSSRVNTGNKCIIIILGIMFYLKVAILYAKL